LLDLAEWQNSGITGLGNTEFIAKTLQANASDVEISLSAGVRTSITLGFTLGKTDIAAGPYMDLPRFNMTANQLATDDVGANCEENGDTDVKFKDAFQNLTHVQYNVGLAAGVKADVGLWRPSKGLLSTQIPVATQCLVWQSEGSTKQFAPATAVLESMMAPPPSSTAATTAGPSSTAKKSAAATLGCSSVAIMGITTTFLVFMLAMA